MTRPTRAMMPSSASGLAGGSAFGARPSRGLAAMALTGSASITHNDRGGQDAPNSAAGWAESDWVPASATRAWCLEDPILDWLSVHGKACGYTPDNESPTFDPRCDMQSFVMAKGADFGDRIVKLLAERTALLLVERAASGGRVGFRDTGPDSRGHNVDPLDRFAAIVEADAAERVMVQISDGYEDTHDLKSAVATFAAMRKGVPLISQAVLRNPQAQTFGAVDLLVRSDILRDLFPSEISAEAAAVGAPELEAPVIEIDVDGNSNPVLRPAPWHYVALEVKFKTLDLLVDGSASSEMLSAMAQVWIYNRALGRLQGYLPPASYLLGRSWRQGSGPGGHGAFERLARVDDGRILGDRGTLEDIVAAACDWRRRLKHFGASWDVTPMPSVPELAPHMRNDDDGPWHGAKKQIAEITAELTLLPGMNPRRRAAANQLGIMRWDDAAPGISGSVLDVAPYLMGQCDAVLAANRPRFDEDGHSVANSADNAVLPAHIGLYGWRIPAPIEFYVDFESISNLDDDFGALPAVGGTPMIFQIGCGWLEDGTRPVNYVAGQTGVSGPIAKAGSWGFRQFTVDALNETEELRIIDEFVSFVAGELDRRGLTWDQARFIHYSSAEKSLMDSQYRGARTRHPEAVWPAELPWWDFLARVIRAEPVTVRGAFSFGLKPMTKAMTEAGLIDIEWKEGPADGLGATIGAFWAAKEAKRLGIPFSQVELIKSVGKYNEIDCFAVAGTLTWCRQHK